MTAAAAYRFCPACATPLQLLSELEDSGPKTRLRCPACGWTHWNNPTPVLAAVIELADRGGQVLLARNAAWPGKFFGLITGFMEAGETPQEGITREIGEETSLTVETLELIGVHDFQRMNQVLITYHAVAHGEIVLSPELVEYRLVPPAELKCWPAGTGYALADWLRSRGHAPQWIDLPPRDATEPA
jgi:NAD+ diphosphatase